MYGKRVESINFEVNLSTTIELFKVNVLARNFLNAIDIKVKLRTIKENKFHLLCSYFTGEMSSIKKDPRELPKFKKCFKSSKNEFFMIDSKN